MRGRPTASDARRTSSCGVEAARTTSTTPSTIDDIRWASGSSITGGVSRITQSKDCRASSSRRFMRSEVRPAIGSELGRPAGSTARRVDTCRTSIFVSPLDNRPSARPEAVSRRNTECSVGRRRSPSINSTRFWYDSLKVRARLEAVSVLPSPATALATITTCRPAVLWASCSTAASRRYCSRDAEFMFSSMTTFSLRRASIRSNSVDSDRSLPAPDGWKFVSRGCSGATFGPFGASPASTGYSSCARATASRPVSVSSEASAPVVWGASGSRLPARRSASSIRLMKPSPSQEGEQAPPWTIEQPGVLGCCRLDLRAHVRDWLARRRTQQQQSGRRRRRRFHRHLAHRVGGRPIQVEVAAHLAHGGAVDRPLTDGKSRQQGVVSDHADRARHAARPLVNQRDGLAREHLRADSAGGANASRQIPGRLLQRQRPQLAAQRDALLQLPQVRVVQQRRDLGLTRQDHRQQLALAGLDVCQQPDLFEDVARQALRLVHEQHRGLAEDVAALERLFQLVEQRRLRFPRL